MYIYTYWAFVCLHSVVSTTLMSSTIHEAELRATYCHEFYLFSDTQGGFEAMAGRELLSMTIAAIRANNNALFQEMNTYSIYLYLLPASM